MKTFTHDEVLSFIHAQDPAREVNMGDSEGNSCGCLMVQMARDLLRETDIYAGYTGIYAKHSHDHIAKLSKPIRVYTNKFTETNYAELQARNPLP